MGSLLLNLLLYFLVGLVVVTISFLIYFYRDPERFPPQKSNIIVSPADGKIVYVKKIDKGHVLSSVKGGKIISLKEIVWTEDVGASSGYIVGVFMSRFDVHVNRAPISGKIVKATYMKGRFVPMVGDRFERENERNVVVIEHESGFRCIVVQIASYTVRRIDCYVKEGDYLKVGDRIGMVKFGSQVDLVIPLLPQLEILTKPGDKVRAGETIIAEYKDLEKEK